MKTQITYLGIELEVDYDTFPAQKGGMTDPSWDAGIDMNGVTSVHPGADLCELLEPTKRDHWAEIEALVIETEKDY